MTTLSDQQQSVIARLHTHNVACEAVAGAGKTTLLLHAARALAQQGRRTLMVTYNRALRDECTARVKRDDTLKSFVGVYTYHGLQTMLLGGRPSFNDKQFLANMAALASGELQLTEQLFQFDDIFVDECQDMRLPFCKFLQFVLRRLPVARRDAMHVLLVGDPQQLLYDYDPHYPADARFMAHAEAIFPSARRGWAHARLSVSFRTTPRIAAFVEAVVGTRRLEPGNVRVPCCTVQYVTANPYGQRIVTYLQGLVDEVGAANVLVLAPSVKGTMPIHRIINKLTCLVAVNERDMHCASPGAAVEKNKLRVCTYHAAKGLEAAVVVVFGFDDFLKKMWRTDTPCAKNALYVALTRSCGGRLVVVQDWRNEPLLPSTTAAEEAAVVHRIELDACFFSDTSRVVQERPYTVTDLTSHADSVMLAQLLEHVRVTPVCSATAAPEIAVEHLVEFGGGDAAYTEDVSALYGVAIPMSVEHAMTGRCKLAEMVLHPVIFEEVARAQERFEDVARRMPGVLLLRRAAYNDRFPLNQRTALRSVYELEPKTPAHWLYIANACLAFDRYHFLFKQVTHYAWVDTVAFDAAHARLMMQLRAAEQVVAPGLVFEQHVEWVIEKPGVIGRVDAVTAAVVHEFKFITGDLQDEHVLQAALYAAMLGAARALLFNVRTGEMLQVEAPEPATLMRAAIAAKTPQVYHKTDAQFLADILE